MSINTVTIKLCSANEFRYKIYRKKQGSKHKRMALVTNKRQRTK